MEGTGLGRIRARVTASAAVNKADGRTWGRNVLASRERWFPTASPPLQSMASLDSRARSTPTVASRGVVAQPLLQFRESHPAALIKADEEREGCEVIELQHISVHLQERRRHCNGDPLVSIYERMVLRQALPKGSRFLNDVIVVTGLWPRQR